MNLLFKCFQRRNWLIGSLALLMSLGWNNGVRAEGSADLIRNGGNRPFLDYRTDTLGGIPRRNVIKVYLNAAAGETLTLGSSANGLGNGRINYRSPSGVNGTCPFAGNVGLIQNRDQEVNKTFTPCIVDPPDSADNTGVWEIEFTGPNIAGNTDPSLAARGVNDNWTQPNDASYIAAWDVTVRNSANQPLSGRVYANYLPLNLGANTLSLQSQTYIQTKEGYLYQVNLNGIDPFGFIFFANNNGFLQAGNPAYKSINIDLNNNNLLDASDNIVNAGLLHSPNATDTATSITHKIFFNQPSSDLPPTANTPAGTTWLLNAPETPAIISSLRFEGDNTEKTLNRTGFGAGGNFIFESSKPGYYAITIDVNRNDVFGDDNDVVLTGPATSGVNTIPWNGQGRDGIPVPAGITPYSSKLTFFNGDVHFPFLDPENNPNGLIIQRLNSAPNVTADPYQVFYDDSSIPRPPTTTPPTPISALQGISSSGGVHGFSNSFGDVRGIDTWTSLLAPIQLLGGILIQQANIEVTKSVTPNPVVAGNQLTYTITVQSSSQSNSGSNTSVQGVTVTDTVPSILTGVTWTCAITNDVTQPGDPNPIQNKCGTASGTGNDINLTVDLNVEAVATITVTGVVSPIADEGEITNTASVTNPPGIPDPIPENTGTASTRVEPAPNQPAGVKSVRIFTDSDNSGTPTTGDTVEYTITYVNRSAQDLTNFQATDPIESDKLDFAGGYSFTASGAGTTITANSDYNGTTDTNLNTIGTLGAEGQIEVKYRAVIKAPAGTAIPNQASATSSGGTINLSKSFAIAPPGSIQQKPIIPGAPPQPTIIDVGGNTAGSSLRLLKRITNITRNGVPISGINFNSFTDDPNDENDTAAGWSQLPGGSPVGVFDVGTEASLQSGDDVEYAVYFLADGTQPAQSIKVCDPIPEGTIFTPGSISVTLPSSGLSNSTQTDAADSDRGSFIPSLNVTSPYSSPPCPNPNNPTGAVFVDLGDIPNTAPNNVGFVRFRTRIK